MSITASNYIFAVLQHGNISKAADVLGISQPALSTHIRKIEEQVGITIFDRTVKPLGLTEEGQAYVEYLKQQRELEREFREQLAELDELKKGTLVVGGASFFNVSYFPRAIAAFSRRYPNVDITVIDGSMPEIAEKAINHELDLFIAPPWNMDERFVYEKISSEKIFLCVPEKWNINKKLQDYQIPHQVILDGKTDQWIREHLEHARVDFKEFRNEAFIKLGENQHIGNIMAQLFARHGFQPKGCISVEQTMTSYGLTLAGAGISLITEGSLRNGHMKGYPALYLIDEVLGERDMYVAYLKQRYLSRAAKEFINILKQSL